MVAVLTTLVATAQTPTVALAVEVAAHLLLGTAREAVAELMVMTGVPALDLLFLLVAAAAVVGRSGQTPFMAARPLVVLVVQVRQGITGGRPLHRR